ncbi:hypothetical protein GCM10027296_09620 [Chitinimonas naiadis]
MARAAGPAASRARAAHRGKSRDATFNMALPSGLAVCKGLSMAPAARIATRPARIRELVPAYPVAGQASLGPAGKGERGLADGNLFR